MRLAATFPLFVAPILLFAAASVWAEESVSVCFNYGCAAEQEVTFSESQLAWVREILEAATTAERERQWLALAVGQLYAWAGEQSPIWRDRGGNYADSGEQGEMDCIDHSTTTTRLLRMLERRGWLRFHRVLEPARRTRFLIFEHLSALIEEAPPRWLPKEVPVGEPLLDAPQMLSWDASEGKVVPRRFVVDSWFVDNGQPAVVLPLKKWLKGGGPNV